MLSSALVQRRRPRRADDDRPVGVLVDAQRVDGRRAVLGEVARGKVGERDRAAGDGRRRRRVLGLVDDVPQHLRPRGDERDPAPHRPHLDLVSEHPWPAAATRRPPRARTIGASIRPASVITPPLTSRFTSTWSEISAPAARASAAAAAARAPGSDRRPSAIRRPPAIPAASPGSSAATPAASRRSPACGTVSSNASWASFVARSSVPIGSRSKPNSALVGEPAVEGEALAPQRDELLVVGRQHQALALSGRAGGERTALEERHLRTGGGDLPGRRRADHPSADHDHVRHARRSLQAGGPSGR